MIRKIIIVLVLFFIGIVVINAQQLSNVLLTQTGKAIYKISINNIYIMVSDAGKLTEIKTDNYGTIVYDTDKRVERIGDTKIGFNYKGLVNMIGNTSILYDYSGRVDQVGTLSLKYNYNNLLSFIGNQQIIYNANKIIDQIGTFKIYYNYNAQVQRIDDSKGLIVLQLNYVQ